MDASVFIIILTCILFSAFFSGVEIAYLSANKLKIELENKQGYFHAKILSFFVRKPSKFIATMLLGNNIALVVYGLYMAMVLEPPIKNYIWENGIFVLVMQTILSTLLILFTAEFLPKAVFRINPNGILKIFALPTLFIYFILWLPMMLLTGLSHGIIRLFTGKPDKNEKEVGLGRIDLDNYVKEVAKGAAQSKSEIDHEIQIFRNALDFSKVKVRDCMVPRTEIVAVDVEAPIEEIKKKFIDTRLSKILVYRENIDHLIGYVHSYELFRQPENIKSILLPVSLVPETMPAQKLLEEFTRQSRTIAVVIDEFGGTSGIVTMEDVIEEIFGEIDDEHDTEELIEEKTGENEYRFSGRLEISYLNQKYQLNLSDTSEYETLSGYIIHHTEEIPEKNSSFEIGNYRFTVLSVSGNRIELVSLKPLVE
ncbi:MAG: hemolysin family protein [Bacteroidota bacterium]